MERGNYPTTSKGEHERSRLKSRSKSSSAQKDRRNRRHQKDTNHYSDRRSKNYYKNEGRSNQKDWRRDNRQHNHDNRYKNNQYQHNNNDYRRNRYDKNFKQLIPKVKVVEVEPPKIFILAEKDIFKGKFKVNIQIAAKQPNRMQESLLGELKNKITPIEKLWSSHIKQYLNISEFVEIYRHNKSLSYEPIEYGKTIIKYQDQFNSIVYSNKVQQAQIFSRAYFKLWEILELGILDEYKNQELSIGNVAEGPGGFIHALVDYRLRQQSNNSSNRTLAMRDVYNAITLKIDSNTRHAKDWSDGRGIKLFKRLREIGPKINLSYGKTETGDLLKTQNIEYFQAQVKKKCQLVTGDGGIECIGDKQFEYQEVFNVKLFLGEIITALHIQQLNGKFILKIYDCGFQLTRQLIMLLALYYGKVEIIKPITSRPGNSEKYLLCQNFRGISQEQLSELKKTLQNWVSIEPKLSYFQNIQFVQSLFDFSHIENYQTVYNNIKEANDWFVNEQIQKLEQGLLVASKHPQNSRSLEQQLKQTRLTEQISFAYAWCQKYGLPTVEVQIIQNNSTM